MIYISTYPLPGERLTEFADAHAEDMGYELFSIISAAFPQAATRGE